MSCFFPKKSSAVLDYQHDWESRLGGDTISTSTWAVTGGLVVDSDSNTDTTATAVLSGGTKGTCTAVNTIVTAGGKTHVETITIRIVD